MNRLNCARGFFIVIALGFLLPGALSAQTGCSNGGEQAEMSNASNEPKGPEILVQFKPGVPESVKRAVRKKADVVLKKVINTKQLRQAGKGTSGLEVVVPRTEVTAKSCSVDSALTALEQDPAVQFAELNVTYEKKKD